MHSRRDDVDPAAAVEHALAAGRVGVGGVLSRLPRDLAEALVLTDGEHDERTARRLERFAAVPVGSFAWTRHPREGLFLGRITGEWEYDASPAAVAAATCSASTTATWSAAPRGCGAPADPSGRER